MENIRKIRDSIYWVGASDRRIPRFENMFPLTQGVSYNSYVIIDDKTVLMDTVDTAVTEQYLENVHAALDGRTLDYLIVHHMEPDHCRNVVHVLNSYPEAKFVGNAKTFTFFEQFYSDQYKDRYHLIKEKDTLSLGTHELTFLMAPMVHWPEVFTTYESTTKTWFTADAFGTFNALNGNIFSSELDIEKDWLAEYRRYYLNIVGKFGAQVQMLFKKVADLEIDMIAPLHGPVLDDAASRQLLLEKYDTWSKYEPEDQGVVLVFASMYGNTEQAIQILATKLAEKGVKNIHIYDVSNTHSSYILAQAHRFSHAVFTALTYNTGLYHEMAHFLDHLVDTGYRQRTVAMITNMSWGSKAADQMREILNRGKDITIIDDTFLMKSALKEDQKDALNQLASSLASSILGEK